MEPPLKIDQATLDGEFGHYARILIDVDLLKVLPINLLIERNGHSFFVDIEYGKLPEFCGHCHSVGHSVVNCRKQKAQSSRVNADEGKKQKEKEVNK